MKKHAYFDSYWGSGWPEIHWLKPYFLAPAGRRWFSHTGNDSAGFTAEGVDKTEHLPANKGRIDIRLEMWGNPNLGVLLIYSKWGGGYKETFTSKGDARHATSCGTVHPIRRGLESGQGVHRNGRQTAGQHRLDRQSGFAAQYVPRSLNLYLLHATGRTSTKLMWPATRRSMAAIGSGLIVSSRPKSVKRSCRLSADNWGIQP
jgi:hypothetical protein